MKFPEWRRFPAPKSGHLLCCGMPGWSLGRLRKWCAGVARIQDEDRERIILIVDEEKILSPKEARALREAAGA